MANGKKKVVLERNSGGLDTACILKDLLQRGYDVHRLRGGRWGSRGTSRTCGAGPARRGPGKVFVEDLKDEFVQEFIFRPIAGNVQIYENRYLWGTSLARR